MVPLTFPILCDTEYIQARDAHYTALADVYAGQANRKPYFVNGVNGASTINHYRNPEEWVSECLTSLAAKAEVLKDTSTFRPLVVQCNLYGVHFIDQIFGAHTYATKTGWWADPLTTPVGQLQMPDLDQNQTWRLARTIAEAFVASKVTLPIFSLPTIASALNIAVNLYNEEFLIALISYPDAAHRDLAVINELLCTLHRWYLKHIPPEQLQPVVGSHRVQPPGYGQTGGCTTHLISAALYREFVAPLDAQLLSTYPHGGMIHLCGAHTQHIPVWREMSSLRAVQLNDRAADDFENYFHELRNDQVIYVQPTRNMNLSRIMEISGGQRVVIMGQAPAVTSTTTQASG